MLVVTPRSSRAVRSGPAATTCFTLLLVDAHVTAIAFLSIWDRAGTAISAAIVTASVVSTTGAGVVDDNGGHGRVAGRDVDVGLAARDADGGPGATARSGVALHQVTVLAIGHARRDGALPPPAAAVDGDEALVAAREGDLVVATIVPLGHASAVNCPTEHGHVGNHAPTVLTDPPVTTTAARCLLRRSLIQGSDDFALFEDHSKSLKTFSKDLSKSF